MTMKELIRPKDLELVVRLVPVSDDRATGELMRKARLQRGISVRELARRLKWSAAYVSDCERGHRLWTDKKVEQFATALGYRNNGVNQ